MATFHDIIGQEQIKEQPVSDKQPYPLKDS